MKLVSFRKDNSCTCGILAENGIADIPAAWQWSDPPKSLLQVLQKGQPCLEKLNQLTSSVENMIPLSSVTLVAPVQRPGKLLALAGNYSAHIEEVGKKIGMSKSPRKTTVPRPFLMPPTVLIGPEETIPWPIYSQTIDYEIELAVIIGKTAKCVPPEVALDYVAGYTIANDVSARSVTFKHGRTQRPWDEFYDWLNGKWADGFLPMGPYLLTADEVENAQNLDMELTVNGHLRQKANTSQMIYPVADIVSFLSHLMTLEPGDCIATGTPAGVALATGNFLKPGDQIECKIDKLGTLKNTLGPRPEKFYRPLL